MQYSPQVSALWLQSPGHLEQLFPFLHENLKYCLGSCILTSEAWSLGAVVSISPQKLEIQSRQLHSDFRGLVNCIIFYFSTETWNTSILLQWPCCPGSCTLTSEARSLGVVVPISPQKLGTQSRQLHCVFRGQVTLGSCVHFSNLEDSLGSCTLTSEARSLGVVVPISPQKCGIEVFLCSVIGCLGSFTLIWKCREDIDPIPYCHWHPLCWKKEEIMVELKYRLCSVCCSVMKKHPLFEKAAAYVAGIVNEEHARDPARAVRSKTGPTHTHTHTHYAHAHTHMFAHTHAHSLLSTPLCHPQVTLCGWEDI